MAVHHHIHALCKRLGIPITRLRDRERVKQALATAENWRALCALANARHYTGCHTWLCDMASDEKERRRASLDGCGTGSRGWTSNAVLVAFSTRRNAR